MAEQWLSIVEYARTFAVSDMTVRRRIKNGKLHAVLKDGKYYIPVSVAGQQNQATPQPMGNAQQPANMPVMGQQRATAPTTLNVIKDHPTAQATFPQQNTVPWVELPGGLEPTPQLKPTEPPMKGSDSPIPSTIRTPLSKSETSIVDTRALLAFCEATMKRSGEAERRQSEKFRYKMSTLEEQLKNKDQEINQLRQQIEDMKVLIDILEKRQS